MDDCTAALLNRAAEVSPYVIETTAGDEVKTFRFFDRERAEDFERRAKASGRFDAVTRVRWC